MNQQSGSLACQYDALSVRQRAEHQANWQRLMAAVEDRQELEDGLAFRFPADSELIQALAAFISLERLCCPFLNFVLEVKPESGPLWLRLTGPAGTKELLELELALP